MARTKDRRAPRLLVAQLIYATRLRSGKTLKQFAAMCGLSEPTLSRLERGLLRVTDERALKIAPHLPGKAKWWEIISD